MSQAPIPREKALKICHEIQEDNKRKRLGVSKMWCGGCVKFSCGDPQKMCFANVPDGSNLGCAQVNKRFEQKASQ